MLCLAAPARAAEGISAKIIKVLPQFIDREGKHSPAPSLYTRDAYQAFLRQNPQMRGGIRFAVQWKAHELKNLTMRVEMRGLRVNEATTANLISRVEKRGWFSTWSDAVLKGEEYRKFGELIAWRVSLWDGNQQLAEQKSFLW